MSKSRIIIQRIIMVVALFYIAIGIIDKDYFTLGGAIGIYVFELLIMNWNDKNKSKEENKINKK
jgi:hypothetical protein